MEKHLQELCQEASIPCPFKAVGNGCTFETKRRLMDKHVTDKQLDHLLCAATACSEMSVFISKEIKSPTPPEKKKTTFDWVITNFKYEQTREINEEIKDLRSPVFYTGPCRTGYALELEVHLNGHGRQKGTHISMYVRIRKGKNDNALLWPFPADDRMFKLQLLHSETEEVVKELYCKANALLDNQRRQPTKSSAGLGRSNFIALSDLHELATDVTDRLHVRCIVDW